MSAYVCEDKTINRIVNGLEYAKEYGSRRDFAQPPLKLQEIMGVDMSEFGKKLHVLNCDAVAYRYNEKVEFTYKYKSEFICTQIQLYKAIQCYLYQCSEGAKFQESDLFKGLEDYMGILARDLVEKTKEYESAEWG